MTKNKKGKGSYLSRRLVPDDVQWLEITAPRKWAFKKPGDQLIGRFVRVEQRIHPNNGPYRAVLIDTEDGVLYATGTGLMSLVDAAGLREFELVRIIYDGTVETTEGYFCNTYRLMVEKRPQTSERAPR